MMGQGAHRSTCKLIAPHKTLKYNALFAKTRRNHGAQSHLFDISNVHAMVVCAAYQHLLR
jgi:hypothetical protein